MTKEALRPERRFASSLVGRAVCAAVGLTFALAACSNSPQRPSSSEGSEAALPDGVASAADACDTGDERECYETVSVRGRELGCYEGVQTCNNGAWGPCQDGEVVTRTASASWSSGSSAGWLALSEPVDCINNPCNPRCRFFEEVPDPGPYTPDGDPPENVIGGLPSDAPEQSGCYWGNDCQYDYRCDGPHTDSTCPHHKCESGAALGACRANDPCVDAVCSAEASCCTGAWTDACVAMVYSVCDTFCIEETIPCQHHVCVEGSALTCNDPCVAAVCEQRSSCCDTAWDAECVALTARTDECSPVLPTGAVPSLEAVAELCEYAAYSETTFTMMQGGAAFGKLGSAGDMSLTNPNLTGARLRVGSNLTIDNGSVTGGAEVAQNFTIRNSGAMLRGYLNLPVRAGGAVTLSTIGGRLTNDTSSPSAPTGSGAASGFTGAWTSNTSGVSISPLSISLATPAECGATQAPPAAVGGVYTLQPLAATAHPSAAYAAMYVDGTLRLSEGRYVFQSLTMNANSRMELSYGTTGIDIHVCGALTLSTNITITQPTSFTQLRWFQYGTNRMTIDVQGYSCYVVPGVFIAPNAQIYVAPHTYLNGVVYGHALQFEPGANGMSMGYASTMCTAAAEPVCNSGYLPAPTPTSRDDGECVPWELGDTDAGCSGFDLALGMPCSETLMVCNHGTAEAPAGVELALFDPSVGMPAAAPVADSTNDDYLGSCFTTRPIAPGSCLSQACEPGLLDQLDDLNESANVVAIAPAGTTECNGIENWTEYEPDVACMCRLANTAASDLSASSCEVSFSGLGAADVETLGWEQSSGVVTQFGSVANAASCSADALGYYVEDSSVHLCPDACTAVLGDSGSALQAIGTCEGSPYVVTEFVDTLDYQATCTLPGTAPQWDMLTWVASTPHDSTITFEVRTAATQADLASAAWAEVGRAWRASGDENASDSAATGAERDTEVCDAFTKLEECPVLLPLLALGEDATWEMPQLRYPFLQLRITIDPGTMLWGNDQFPELFSWDLSYSCLDSE